MALINSLDSQTFPKERFEFILVDDGSRDSTAAVAQAALDKTVLNYKLLSRDRAASYGPGPARNDGLALARGRIIAFTDADCVPDQDWLEQIERSVLVDGHTIVAGRIWCDSTLIFPWRVSPAGSVGVTANLTIDTARTGAIRFSDFYQGYGGEDVDLIFRLRKKGFAPFNDGAVDVQHPPHDLGLIQVMRRAFDRMNELSLRRMYGVAVLEAFSPVFRPVLFGRVSLAGLAVILEFGAVFALSIGNSFVKTIVLAMGAVVAVWFLCTGYRVAITYRPAEVPYLVSIRERIRTLVAVAVYLPAFFAGRLFASWRNRFFMI